MSLEEFKETLAEGWEIDFTIGETSYHYQRSCQDGVFQLYLTTESETLYETETSDMAESVDELLALAIYDGKTIDQLEGVIKVISSS
ncbi:hypothetical protein [Slackia heliotrinireducens]|uniref:Uncharacterized protein n=1 Tax=Slackia heliotrinireducens (strain ATCC 29202 / DSM 20476 / NCTC 11029 / RHS 1) TaxID=471855 RepID=C7N486_SLAHD|nr:hypothetical protein [Slackia heliotrinireducens]ACV23822.1 hypothetical protein Shel_28330 [Slackia heliotrinireducens DSM 20476]